MREYYPFNFTIKGKKYFCCWYTNDEDGFLQDGNRLISFKLFEQLNDFALKQNIQLNKQKSVATLSVDQVNNWLEKNEKKVDCKTILDFWNIVTDIAHSLGVEFYGNLKESILSTIYDKLFWGNNLPTVTPKSKSYIPQWKLDELEEIRKVIIDGLTIIDNALFGK